MWLKDTLNYYAIFITLDINCKSINNLVSCFIGCKQLCTCLAYAIGIENCYIYTSSICHSHMHNTDKCAYMSFTSIAAQQPSNLYLLITFLRITHKLFTSPTEDCCYWQLGVWSVWGRPSAEVHVAVGSSVSLISLQNGLLFQPGPENGAGQLSAWGCIKSLCMVIHTLVHQVTVTHNTQLFIQYFSL